MSTHTHSHIIQSVINYCSVIETIGDRHRVYTKIENRKKKIEDSAPKLQYTYNTHSSCTTMHLRVRFGEMNRVVNTPKRFSASELIVILDLLKCVWMSEPRAIHPARKWLFAFLLGETQLAFAAPSIYAFYNSINYVDDSEFVDQLSCYWRLLQS